MTRKVRIDLPMDEAQERCFEDWVSSDEAIHLIGGEDRNHVDTAFAAFRAGWNMALEKGYQATSHKAGL